MHLHEQIFNCNFNLISHLKGVSQGVSDKRKNFAPTYFFSATYSVIGQEGNLEEKPKKNSTRLIHLTTKVKSGKIYEFPKETDYVLYDEAGEEVKKGRGEYMDFDKLKKGKKYTLVFDDQKKIITVD